VIAFLEGNSKIGLRQPVDQIPCYHYQTISFELHAKMAEEIDVEKCNFRNFTSSVTLTLDRVKVILLHISGRGLRTRQIRSKSEKLLVDQR